MVKNITLALILSWLYIPNLLADNTEAKLDINQAIHFLKKYGNNFANLEHRRLGDNIELHLLGQDKPAKGLQLSLPNGLKLSYGDIVMLAGDFFGDQNYPISSCLPKQRSFCFHQQFAALAEKPLGSADDHQAIGWQVQRLANYINQIQTEIDQANSQGIETWQYYKNHNTEITKALNVATGGGSIITDLYPFGSYVNLATVNFDHFQPDAQIAYTSGHHFALKTAIKAKQAHDNSQESEAKQLLQLAYAQNAFANHFLSDAFSTGHLRTPRRVIDEQVSLPGVLQLLVANLMHDEDNAAGFLVSNKLGDTWQAYGDGYLDETKSQDHFKMIQRAMQLSADAIYTAYKTGEEPLDFAELDLLPDADRSDVDFQSSPLFKVENGVLLKRKSIHNNQDYHWTDLWSGLLMLIEFKMG